MAVLCLFLLLSWKEDLWKEIYLLSIFYLQVDTGFLLWVPENWNDSSIEPKMLLWRNSESFTPFWPIVSLIQCATWSPKNLAGPRCSETVRSDPGLWANTENETAPIETFHSATGLVLRRPRQTTLAVYSWVSCLRLWARWCLSFTPLSSSPSWYCIRSSVLPVFPCPYRFRTHHQDAGTQPSSSDT